MYCEYCEIEISPGVESCPKCGHSAFVESLDEPDAAGEIVMEPLGTTIRSPRRLAALVDHLLAEEIPHLVHAGNAFGAFEGGPMTSRAPRDQWEARLLVASSRHAEVHELWREVLDTIEDDDEWEDADA